MRLFVLLLLATAPTSAVVLAQSPSSENEGAGSGGLEFLPFSVEGFELNSSVSSLRELDQAVGEAVVVFQRARTRLDITEKLADLQGALVDEKFKAREALHAALQRAKDKAQRQGNAEGLLALQEALSQLDKGQFPISGAYLDGSADREAVKYQGHRYKLFSSNEDRVPWHIAEKRCEQKGGYLACAENGEELDFLVSLVEAASVKRAWVGGSNLQGGDARAWKWMTGDHVDQSLWDEAQPEGYDATLVKPESLLADARSGFRWSYICEWGTALPSEWVFADSTVNKAVLSHVSDLKLATRAHEEQERKLNDKLAKARTAFRKATGKAADKSIKQLKKSSAEAARAGLTEEIHRIEMVSVALQDERLLPDPSMRSVLAGPDSVAARAGAHRFGHSAYKVIEERLGWHDAVRRCEELGGRLAHVKTPHQQHFLVERVLTPHAGDYFWLGASDEEAEGEWRWLDGSDLQLRDREEPAPYVPRDFEGHSWHEDNRGSFDHLLRLGCKKDEIRFEDCSEHLAFFVCEWIY